MYLKFLLLQQEDITKHCLLLLLLPLLPGQEVSPVEEVEDSEDAGEENAGEDVDLLGSKLEVGEPGGHPVRWNSEDKHDSKIALLHSPNAKTKKKREPSIDGKIKIIFLHLWLRSRVRIPKSVSPRCGQKGHPSPAIGDLFKIRNWENSSPKKRRKRGG